MHGSNCDQLKKIVVGDKLRITHVDRLDVKQYRIPIPDRRVNWWACMQVHRAFPLHRPVHSFRSMAMAHPVYNPSFSVCFFFQSEHYFSLTINQPTVFFSRLISTAERDLSIQAMKGLFTGHRRSVSSTAHTIIP
jgi:hypothetical protein